MCTFANMESIYFDNAATTPLRKEVINVLTQNLALEYANASATYAIGRNVKSTLEKSRRSIAKMLNVQASEIVFTSGGTEANNFILQSAIESLQVKHFISTRIEHNAVRQTIDALVQKKNIKVSYIDINSKGSIDLEQLEEILSKSTQDHSTLVSLMHVNNEIGTILDIDSVGALCETYKAWFHSDTVQSIGSIPIDLKKSKVHFASASAHKFYGPKGIGFAVISKESKLQNFMYGGVQERGLRPGTEPVYLIKAMDTALTLCYEHLETEQNHIRDIKQYCIASIKEHLPEIGFNGNSETSANKASLLNINLPINAEEANKLLFKLDLNGVYCSRGSACHSGSNMASHVLSAFLPEKELNKTSLRISFSIFNTKPEIDTFIERLKNCIKDF